MLAQPQRYFLAPSLFSHRKARRARNRAPPIITFDDIWRDQNLHVMRPLNHWKRARQGILFSILRCILLKFQEKVVFYECLLRRIVISPRLLSCFRWRRERKQSLSEDPSALPPCPLLQAEISLRKPSGDVVIVHSR